MLTIFEQMFTKKKILAFAILLAVAAPLLFFTCFLIKQKWIEHEMEERLENASLRTITIDITAVHWIKKNKELTIDGKLFDVRSYTVNGSNVILTGLYDNDEDVLNDQMKNFIQQKNGTNAPLSQAVFNLLFPPLFNNTADTIDQHPWQLITNHFIPYQEKKISNKYLSILPPPPKYA
jgi:hypothetical protein